MPRFTIDLSQKTVDKLQREVARTNGANGTDLTLVEWVHIHLKEIAIAPELSAAVDALNKTEEEAYRQSVTDGARAARDTLIADLEQ